MPAADYGLSTDEILRTPDADLNRLVSVKRLAPYRDREFQVTADRRKRWRRDQAAREEARVAEKEAAKRRRKRARRKASAAAILPTVSLFALPWFVPETLRKPRKQPRGSGVITLLFVKSVFLNL